MQAPLQNDMPKGLTLGLIGGLTLSFDIPLIRLAGSEPYTVMGLRGLGLVIVLFLYWRFFANRSDMPEELLTDRHFILVGGLSGLNNVFFTLAVFNTSTANVVFILAFNAMLAALISWLLIKERPGWHTMAAIGATLVGVAIIVSDGVGTSNLVGDFFALMCALLLAISLTLTRQSGRDLSLAPGFGGAVSFAFALPMILWMQQIPDQPGWLLFDAFILVPIAGITMWLAPRFIPAAHVALFYVLETVLAPLWVWYVFSETPSTNVFIGGSLVVGALTAHGLYELRRRSRLSRANRPAPRFRVPPQFE